MKWMPTPAFNAQAAHFLFGVTAVTAPLAFAPRHPWIAILSTVAFAGYAVAKEIWFDPKFEGPTEPFWPEGAKDLAFLVGGAVATWLLFWWTR